MTTFARGPRLLSRWRTEFFFPWLVATAGATFLTASAHPSGWGETSFFLFVFWFLLAAIVFVETLLLEEAIASMLRRKSRTHVGAVNVVARLLVVIVVAGFWATHHG